MLNGGVEPTNIKETINFIQEIEIKLGLENGMLKRVDFSVDIKQDFYNNKK